MSRLRIFASSSLLALGLVVVSATASAYAADTATVNEPTPPPVEVTTSDGFTFMGIPDGDRYLVDPSVDPDGFVLNENRSSLRSAAAVPPACVTATQDPPGIATRTVRVTNGCAVEQRVKVLAAFSNDSGCLILGPGQVGTHAYNIQLAGFSDPRFDGLEAC